MKPLIIFGTGELAELAFFYFQKVAGRSVVGFCVDAAYLCQPQCRGLPVVAFEEVEQSYGPHGHDMFVALGSTNVNRARAQKYTQAKAKGYTLASFISPRASVHADHIGDNCFIMDNNNIHPYVTIGSNVIFSNDNHIGHHSVVGDHCFITSNVVVGGGAHIGEGSFLGINAAIRDHVRIGSHSIIGAGALILKDTEEGSVYSVEGTRPRTISSDRASKLV